MSKRYLLGFVFVIICLGSAKAADYAIDAIEFQYGEDYSEAPELNSLDSIVVPLLKENEKWTKPTGYGIDRVLVYVGNLQPDSIFTAEGVQAILEATVAHFNKNGYYSVYVVPSVEDINPRTGKDLRSAEDKVLTLDIFLGTVSRSRTIAKGDRLADDAIDNKKHEQILRRSPITGNVVDGNEAYPLLRKNMLDDYLRRLNRHPGRRVDVSIASSGEPGSVYLDYLVTEQKPYTVYAQVSNTGTESTGDWRERVGFIHYQMTGNDDIFTVDFITAEFDNTNTVLSSYQIPIVHPDYLSVEIYGTWSEFTAEDVGVSDIEFNGETASGGAELQASPWSFWNFAVDFVAGVRYADIEVESIIDVSRINVGETDILVPYAGFELERRDGLSSTRASLYYELNTSSIDEDELDSLGRLNASPDWSLFRGGISQSFFMEPLLFGNQWRDTTTWLTSTLAHEVRLELSGQYVLENDRVIPQETFVAGGAYSVRGYPESVASGDNGFFGRFEYLFHFPRVLKPASTYDEPPSKLFDQYNVRPPKPLVFPDWDLALRGFFDYGDLYINDKDNSEFDSTLMSAGAGLDLQLLNNLNIRFDYGFVLKSIEDFDGEVENAQEGDSRAHLIATLSW